MYYSVRIILLGWCCLLLSVIRIVLHIFIFYYYITRHNYIVFFLETKLKY